MSDGQSLADAICDCGDANQVAMLLDEAHVEDAVFRELAIVLAADVVHLTTGLAATLAFELSKSGCNAKVRRIVQENISESCRNSTSETERFACIAARIALFGSHKGWFLVASVCAAAEAAMLSSGARGTTQAIRLHQADVARTLLTPSVIRRQKRGLRAA